MSQTQSYQSSVILLYILIGLVWFFSSALNASEYCSEDWACAGVERKGDGLSVWLENKKPYPITMTLYLNSRNLRNADGDTGKFELTRVIQGHQKQIVSMLYPTRNWSSTWYRYQFKWSPGSMYAEHDPSTRYSLPYASGEQYRVVQGFNGGYSHRGASKYALDFAMPVGTPVHAARKGTVIDLTDHHWRGGASRRYAKYANFVVLLHEDGTTGEYYHLKQWGVAVEVGDVVNAGDLIGYSGNTGFSSLPHLHFAVYHAKPHGGYQSVPIKFSEEPSYYRRNFRRSED